MNKLWKYAGYFSIIITIFLFLVWLMNFVEDEKKLNRGPCEINQNVIYGTVNINKAPVDGVTVILKNERIDSIQTTKTDKEGFYMLTIGNFPECWLERDKISILVQQGLTNYQNSAILGNAGTEISIKG